MPESRDKTFSTGFEKHKLRAYLDLFRYSRGAVEHARDHYRNVFVPLKAYLEQYLGMPAEKARVLEIGCGQRFPITLLFHSIGANVTGIDTDFVDPLFTLKGFRGIWKHNGPERCIKSFARHLLFDRAYYDTIRREFGRPLNFSGLDIRLMDAARLDFPDDIFDYAYSSAVFEHIDRVEGAITELYRVLRPGGVANISIHLWPSLSGGHNLEWASPEVPRGRRVPPWDHLRQNRFPTHAYLNKFRKDDYLALFERHFEFLLTETYTQGEAFLTPEILAEITAYSRDDLLTCRLHVIVRKRG